MSDVCYVISNIRTTITQSLGGMVVGVQFLLSLRVFLTDTNKWPSIFSQITKNEAMLYFTDRTVSNYEKSSMESIASKVTVDWIMYWFVLVYLCVCLFVYIYRWKSLLAESDWFAYYVSVWMMDLSKNVIRFRFIIRSDYFTMILKILLRFDCI